MANNHLQMGADVNKRKCDDDTTMEMIIFKKVLLIDQRKDLNRNLQKALKYLFSR